MFYDPNNASVQFDARKFHWLGSPQQEIGLFVLRTEKGAKSIDDLKRIEVTASSTARNAPTSIYPRMLNSLYGTKIKVVEGYAGSQESLLAVERNEVDGHVSGGSSAAFRARIAPLAQERHCQGDPADGHDAGRGVLRHPDRDRDHADARAASNCSRSPSPNR